MRPRFNARLFLESVATELHEKFQFAPKYSGPSFSDIKKLYKSDRDDVKSLFFKKEWQYMFRLHQYTKDTLHGYVPADYDGTFTVVIPHHVLDRPRLRSIASKAGITDDPKQLLVIDANEVSSGSETSGF